MFENYRIIHFVGIGGIGMSGIAEVLHNLGYEITGSDVKESANTRRLQSLGIRIMIGHRAENVDSAHVVVISSAIKDDNPEVIEARRRSIPVIPRAEMLAEIGRLKYSILVAGAHGKTTTTSLISSILTSAGLDPTVIIGGRLNATGSNARLGQGNFLVAEADESDGSFLKLSPTIAVATNIDREHMDYFKTMDSICAAFREFLDKVPFYGLSVLCYENIYLRNIMNELSRRYITYGFSENADVRAVEIKRSESGGMSFHLIYRGEDLGDFNIPLLGNHNVLNALASIVVSRELYVPVETIKVSLEGFSGIQRRFEFKGYCNGAAVYDDYGHHPTEIKATLKAIRADGHRRLIAIFQPHRYTRTRDLFNEFTESFGDVDRLYVMDIYPAGEPPIKGVDARELSTAIRQKGVDVHYVSERDTLVSELKRVVNDDDIVITLGAGDVWKVAEELTG
ncbi:MAG TPA: UDP-N-acetylmuramate--L-alanine ligase [Nitrospirae bacterium]|nr:UDP-N-acetylmuramate--L-alanine ligase [Nitrospirota bacterium]